MDEASRVLGHDPAVNVRHYAANIQDETLRAKMLDHPSNRLSACCNLVTDAERSECGVENNVSHLRLVR